MLKKRSWEEVRNNPSERPTLLNRFKKSSKNFMNRIKDTFKPIPSNEEAWNSFPEEAKKEMLESLKMKDSVNLYGIDLTKIIELEPSIREDLIFKEGVKKQDSIGEYIEINGHKCRAYQRGISGFAYKDINSKYNPFELFEIGFYEKGTPKNSVIIDLSLKPEQINIPNGEKLGGPFFIKNDPISKDSPIYHILPNDISQYPSRENKDTLTIKGTTFEPFKPGITGFVYYCFDSLNIWNTKMTNIFLAEYKNGEMIGDGVVMQWVKGFEPESSEYCIQNITSGK